MTHLHEPIKEHVHDKMTSAINQAIIDIKLHRIDISKQSPEQQEKIIEARAKTHCPTWEEIAELLTQARDEMDNCTKPFKIH